MSSTIEQTQIFITGIKSTVITLQNLVIGLQKCTTTNDIVASKLIADVTNVIEEFAKNTVIEPVIETKKIALGKQIVFFNGISQAICEYDPLVNVPEGYTFKEVKHIDASFNDFIFNIGGLYTVDNVTFNDNKFTLTKEIKNDDVVIISADTIVGELHYFKN